MSSCCSVALPLNYLKFTRKEDVFIWRLRKERHVFTWSIRKAGCRDQVDEMILAIRCASDYIALVPALTLPWLFDCIANTAALWCLFCACLHLFIFYTCAWVGMWIEDVWKFNTYDCYCLLITPVMLCYLGMAIPYTRCMLFTLAIPHQMSTTMHVGTGVVWGKMGRCTWRPC